MMHRRSNFAALKNMRIAWADAESIPPPTITLVTGGTIPASGGTVSLEGTGFSHMRRALLGTQVLAYAVTDDEHMTVTLGPQVTDTGYLIIETRGGQVYPPPLLTFTPVLTSVTPNTGIAGGGEPIVLAGVGFLTPGLIVYLYDGSFFALPFVVDSNIQITATTVAHAPGGPFDILVYAPIAGGSASIPFTYIASPP